MKLGPRILLSLALLLSLGACATSGTGGATGATDALPSWNDGASRDRIIAFVECVTDPDSEDFVPETDRIAVFDNDGTLWAEKPLYFQLAFAIDRVRMMAPAFVRRGHETAVQDLHRHDQQPDGPLVQLSG